MDKEQARFILRCFRPDGADAGSPDFAEALAWAAEDRELGAWLAAERASDAAFARSLGEVAIPASLREEILAALALERGDGIGVPDEFDRQVMAAMAAIPPPPGLRTELVAAMARTRAPAPAKRAAWRFAAPLAAAAGVALAFLMSSPDSAPEGPATPGDGPVANLLPIANALPIRSVEAGFIRAYQNPDFQLDLQNPDHHALFQHLKSAELPCPSHCLPKGLREIPGLGCRELEIDGKRGALVCFKQDKDMVHLVVFKRCDVKCKLPSAGKPDIGTHGDWAVARWEQDGRVFVMMGERGIDAKRLAGMF